MTGAPCPGQPVRRQRVVVVVGEESVRSRIVDAIHALGWEIVADPGDLRARRRALLTGDIDLVVADRTSLTIRLTPSERDLCRAVASGASNAELARQLGVSQRTVSARLRLLYRRLNVSSRAEIAEWFGSDD